MTSRKGASTPGGGSRGRGGAAAGGRAPAQKVAPRNDLVGEVRRSQLVGTWGPGGIIDLRLKNGDPVSGLIAGLEEWDEAAPAGQRGTAHPQTIYDPRLQRVLGKKGFRLPPVRHENQTDSADILPVVRFPSWLQCPMADCDRLATADDNAWGKELGSANRWCLSCQQKHFKKIGAVPVRFIVACANGHIDEFPWKWWASCKCAQPRLVLKNTGAGLAGKRVRCLSCGANESLDGAFSKTALTRRNFKCAGRRPWLAGSDGDPCNAPEGPRVLQRGGSNVYWGKTASSLDIPPFSIDMEQHLGRYWSHFEDNPPEKWPQLIDLLKIDKQLSLTADGVLELLRSWFASVNSDPTQPFSYEEYLSLVQGCTAPGIDKGQFQVLPEVVPTELRKLISGIGAARRLREVRALIGFTRIHPPSGDFRSPTQQLMPLAANQSALDWLPAIELRGEGIFINFDGDALARWEERPAVQARIKDHQARVLKNLEGREAPALSSRFVLLHSFAHAFMRQLSLECGYSNSALRERLYVYPGTEFSMCGVLIHTGSADSEGTLGGLVRQARVDLLAPTLIAALQSQVWCSSDPLCITGAATLSSPWNGAACHACQLVPETSCTEFNLLLDRAFLVGTPESHELGYFGEVLRALRSV